MSNMQPDVLEQLILTPAALDQRQYQYYSVYAVDPVENICSKANYSEQQDNNCKEPSPKVDSMDNIYVKTYTYSQNQFDLTTELYARFPLFH